jgi:hypothetical protein
VADEMKRFFVFPQEKSYGSSLSNIRFAENQNDCIKIHPTLFILTLLLTVGLSSCNFLTDVLTTVSTETPTLEPPIATTTSAIVIATNELGTPIELCDSLSFNPTSVDVTIPDGTQMVPSQTFTKTWRIKNDGACAWGSGYGLTYAYGEKMSGKPQALATLVEIGQEVEVSVELKAPDKVGEYTSAWQMANGKGIPFGKVLFVKIVVKADEIGTSTSEATRTIVLTPTQTPNPAQILRAAFAEIDSQFNNSLKGNIAFNRPEQMKKGKTAIIELILNPSISESALATQVVEWGNLVTSTADPYMLIAPNGEIVSIETSQVEITPRMKAVLLSQDPESFIVQEMHDNAEQVVSSVNTTTWRWSVMAKKAGMQTLELVIYQLVKYDGKEFWHEVETYKANIIVEVTVADRVKSLDWKWIFATLLIPLAGGLWAWWKNRDKKADVMQVKIVDEKKSPPKRKK